MTDDTAAGATAPDEEPATKADETEAEEAAAQDAAAREPAAEAGPGDGATAGAAGAPKAAQADVNGAWEDVLSEITKLGDAIGRWTKTAADDPENRRRLEQIRLGMDDVASKAEQSFNDISRSEFGSQVRESATQVGQAVGGAAQQVGEAAAPHVAAVFGSLADAFGSAATKVDESVQQRKAAADAAARSAAAEPATENAPAEPAAAKPDGEPEPEAIDPDDVQP